MVVWHVTLTDALPIQRRQQPGSRVRFCSRAGGRLKAPTQECFLQRPTADRLKSGQATPWRVPHGEPWPKPAIQIGNQAGLDNGSNGGPMTLSDALDTAANSNLRFAKGEKASHPRRPSALLPCRVAGEPFHDGSAKYISTNPHSAHCLHRGTSLPSPHMSRHRHRHAEELKERLQLRSRAMRSEDDLRQRRLARQASRPIALGNSRQGNLRGAKAELIGERSTLRFIARAAGRGQFNFAAAHRRGPKAH